MTIKYRTPGNDSVGDNVVGYQDGRVDRKSPDDKRGHGTREDRALWEEALWRLAASYAPGIGGFVDSRKYNQAVGD